MIKNLSISFLLLLSISAFAQDECFEKYVYPVHPNMRIAFESHEKDKQQFIEFIKNCKAPNFKAVTIDGDTIELNKLKGKIVIINFWFMSCAPCVAEIPALNKLVSEYKSKDVVFIGMSRDSKENIKYDFLPEHPFDFKIIPNCESQDEVGSITNRYRIVFGWPSTFVLDKNGRVQFFDSGGLVDERAKTHMYDTLKPIIDDLLKKK